MRRGELYRVYRSNKNDPKDSRVFVIVSRQTLIDSKFSTVVCAPIYSSFTGLSTQLEVGVSEGLKTSSCIFTDEMISIEKPKLTHFIGSISHTKLAELNRCLKIALELD